MPLQDGDLLLVNRNNQSFRETFENLRDEIPGAVNSDTAPANPNEGDLWFNTDDGHLYVFYNDGATSQWVDASLAGGGGGLPPQIEVDAAGPTPTMTLDADGRVLVGTTSASGGTNARAIIAGNANSAPGVIQIASTSASPAIDDPIGVVRFSDSGHTQAATISAERDGGTWTSGTSQPNRLTFATTPDGSTTAQERLRINNQGAFGLAGANFGDAGQVLTSQGNNAAPQWATPAAGGLQQLGSFTLSGNTQRDWTGLGCLTTFKVVITDLGYTGGGGESPMQIQLGFTNAIDLGTTYSYNTVSGGTKIVRRDQGLIRLIPESLTDNNSRWTGAWEFNRTPGGWAFTGNCFDVNASSLADDGRSGGFWAQDQIINSARVISGAGSWNAGRVTVFGA